MYIVKTTWFPFGRYSTINIFGVLFTKLDSLDRSTILHESIHTAQMREMLYIFFYIWYGLEYLAIRVFHRTQNGAYRDISFEEEAYNNSYDWDYLKHRKRFAWFKYIKIKDRK